MDIQTKLTSAAAETAIMMVADRATGAPGPMSPGYFATDVAWVVGANMLSSTFSPLIEDLVPDGALSDDNVATLAQILTTAGVTLAGQRALKTKRRFTPLQALGRSAAGVLGVRELRQRQLIK